jgi:hypothetical protein
LGSPPISSCKTGAGLLEKHGYGGARRTRRLDRFHVSVSPGIDVGASRYFRLPAKKSGHNQFSERQKKEACEENVVDFFTFLRVRERGGLTRNREVLVRRPIDRANGVVGLFRCFVRCAVRVAASRSLRNLSTTATSLGQRRLINTRQKESEESESHPPARARHWIWTSGRQNGWRVHTPHAEQDARFVV